MPAVPALARHPLAGLVAAALIVVGLAAPPAVAAKKSDDAEKSDDEKKTLTLKPTRKIEFSTDEATWLSLDVSPDGTTLALELLGDIYTLPIEGGKASLVSGGMAFDSQPVFSPGGERIAFLSDRDGSENLWIMKADGSEPKNLTNDAAGSDYASPEWTPDGQYVMVSRGGWGAGTFEIRMYHVKGGSGVQVTKAKSSPDQPRRQRLNTLGVTIAPDGRHIYYARRMGGFEYNAEFPMWQVARRDMITGDEDVLTETYGSAVRPVLSPDGSRLVYGTRYETKTGLRIRNLATGEDDWLAYPVTRDDQESIFSRDLLPGYSFTPDGRSLIVTVDGKIRRIDVASTRQEEIPFTVDVSQDLGPLLDFPQRVETGPVRARLIQGPSQSPDGKRLAFSSLTHLYVMEIPGGTPRRLTSGSEREFQPAWSPDGQWLAYVTWETGGGALKKMRADGTGSPVTLTELPAFYSDPAWSPDGSRIVCLRASTYERLQRRYDFGQVPGMDLVWIPAGGGGAHLVIPSRGVGKPHFAAEKDRIYLYLSTSAGNDKAPDSLVSMRFDGTDRREHLKVLGPGYYYDETSIPADDIRISPDGGWALATVRNQLYVTAVPMIGGGPALVDVGSPSLPIAKLTDVGADYFGWADGGRTMTWAVGASFFRQPLASVKFEEKKKGDEDAAPDKGAGKKNDKKAGKKEAAGEEEPPLHEEIAVDIEAPRDVPEGSIVLRGGRVITMRGDEVIDDADILVTRNRIAAVGPAGKVEVPEGAAIRDISGTTVLPGFVDTHAHWFEIRRGVLDVQNWGFLANLAYGVTAGLDVQTSTNDMFAYEDLADAGEILGPRAFSTGPGIFSNNDFETVEQVKGVLEKYKKHYRTRNLKSYIVGNRKQRQLMAEASAELEMMPTTEGGLDLKLDLTHVLDGFHGNEHSLPIVPLYRDVVELVARSGTAYTPTLLVNYGGPWAENFFYETTEVHDDPKLNRFTPHEVIDEKTRRRPWFRKDEYAYPETAASAAKIIRAGGRVGVGGHGQLQGLGYHWEMWALAEGGLTPMEVLRAATADGAAIIGYPEDLGSIEPGKLADLVVLEKNPLDDIRNTNTIRLVMKNGRMFVGDTLEEVWPEKKELAPLWFARQGP